jgi:3',5'-cyclic AMP phosphodiesterase CpdA
MRTLVHLSDLHFGRVDETLLAPLAQAVASIKPDVVVVSGDLTQRARIPQFQAAREFLDTLPSPQIVVPGNHDVSLHNVVRRFLQPLDRYSRYIVDDLEPAYSDAEIAVIGINSARSLTVKSGRINAEQIVRMRERFARAETGAIRIVVTHHPFDVPHPDGKHIIGRATMAIDALAECRVDLLLAGHLHLSHTITTASRYRIPGFGALVVQAGTATSVRRRDETNSFNLIRVEPSRIAIQPHVWDTDAKQFLPSLEALFLRQPDGWEAVSPTPGNV